MSFELLYPRVAVGVPVEFTGAKGDGVTDDAAAINAAATQALAEGHGVVLFQGKDYLIKSKIVHQKGIIWRGQGRTKSRIIGDNLTGPLWGAPDPSFSTDSADRVIGGSIEGLTFDNLDKDNAGGVGIDLSQISYVFVRDVTCNRVETGIRADHVCYGCKVENFTCSDCDDGVQARDGCRELALSYGRITNCGNGIVVAEDSNGGVNGCSFEDITIEGFDTVGVDIDCTSTMGVNSLTMQGMRYENDSVGTAITADGPIGRVEDLNPHVTGTVAYLGGTHAHWVCYREQSLGTKENISGVRKYTVKTTTDDGVAKIAENVVTVGSGARYFLRARIFGSNSDGTIIYKRNTETVAYNTGGGVSFGGTVQDNATTTSRVNGGTTTNGYWNNSGTTVFVAVQGEAATDMDWTIEIEVLDMTDLD